MKDRERLWTLVSALMLCVSAGWAQQTAPPVNPPVAPQGPVSPGQSGSRAEPEPPLAVPAPDTRPLSGVERFTLGEMGKRRSYLLPSFEFSEAGDTNSTITSSSSQTRLDAVSTLLARMSLQRVWSRYQLTGDFTAGGYIYQTRSGQN